MLVNVRYIWRLVLDSISVSDSTLEESGWQQETCSNSTTWGNF